MRDTGGPLRTGGVPLAETSGSVRESGGPLRSAIPGSIGGVPVSAGSRGVYGDGSVRDSSAGCVRDMSAVPVLPSLPVEILPLSSPEETTLPDIEASIRNLRPSEPEHVSPPAEGLAHSEETKDVSAPEVAPPENDDLLRQLPTRTTPHNTTSPQASPLQVKAGPMNYEPMRTSAR